MRLKDMSGRQRHHHSIHPYKQTNVWGKLGFYALCIVALLMFVALVYVYVM